MKKRHIFNIFKEFDSELFYGVTEKDKSLPFNFSLALHTG